MESLPPDGREKNVRRGALLPAELAARSDLVTGVTRQGEGGSAAARREPLEGAREAIAERDLGTPPDRAGRCLRVDAGAALLAESRGRVLGRARHAGGAREVPVQLADVRLHAGAD